MLCYIVETKKDDEHMMTVMMTIMITTRQRQNDKDKDDDDDDDDDAKHENDADDGQPCTAPHNLSLALR